MAETREWEPLESYLGRTGLSRYEPMRAGDPCGPDRLDMVFATEGEQHAIRVRGYPEKIVGAPQLIPPVEFYGYLVDERSGRLIHVASGVTWYGVEVAAPAGAVPDEGRPNPAPAAPPSRRVQENIELIRTLCRTSGIARGASCKDVFWILAKVYGEGHPLLQIKERQQRRYWTEAKKVDQWPPPPNPLQSENS
jgi:hypothetical protein